MTTATLRLPAFTPVLGVDELLFLLGVLAAPLAATLPSVAGRVGPGEACFAASFVLLVGLRRRETLDAVLANPLRWHVTALIAALMVSAVLGETGFRGVLQATALGFYLLIGIPLAMYHRRLVPLMWAVLAGVVLVDALSVLTAAAGFSFAAWDAGAGRYRTLLTPVGALATSATALTGYFAAGTLLRFRVWSALALALAILTVFYDQSRTAMLSVLLVILVVGAASQLHRTRTIRFSAVRRSVYALVGVVSLALAAFALSRTDRVAEQLTTLATSGSFESTDVVRTLGYREAVTAVMAHPWLGPGLGTVRDPLFDQVVHNAYLQLAADVSVFAAVILMLMLGRSSQLVWGQVRETLGSGQTDNAIFALAALGVILTLAVKFLFHPLGLVMSDWIHFLVAASTFGGITRTELHATA